MGESVGRNGRKRSTCFSDVVFGPLVTRWLATKLMGSFAAMSAKLAKMGGAPPANEIPAARGSRWKFS